MDKAQHLAGEGFPAGLAEMEVKTVFTISGGGVSGVGGALPPSIMGWGMALPSLLVLSLPSGVGAILLVGQPGGCPSPFHLPPFLPGLLLLAYGNIRRSASPVAASVNRPGWACTAHTRLCTPGEA